MANETWKVVQAKSKQVLLGIRDEKARMKVTPPPAVAPLAQVDGTRWNPNNDGIVFNSEGRCAPDDNGKRASTPPQNRTRIKLT